MAKYNCLNCGKEFTAKPSQKRKFCSQQCSNQYNFKNGHPLSGIKKCDYIKVICAQCGKEEWVTPCRAKNYVTCSKQCAAKHTDSKREKFVKICPICGKEFQVQQNEIDRRKTCSKDCLGKLQSFEFKGVNNPRYIQFSIDHVKSSWVDNKRAHRHVVKLILGLGSERDIPAAYCVHHKDCNHFNNDPHNLVLLPKTVHRYLHTKFGSVLIHALHTGLCTREQFFSFCNEEDKKFYEQIIDLDITRQVVVKEGELLENPEEDNQQLSIYRNVYESSETNSRVLPVNAEDSNTDTSALPINDGEDIVRTACITNEDAELEDKELLG